MKITYIPISKAKDLLMEASRNRELTDIQNTALKHSAKFSKLTIKKATELEEELVSAGMPEPVAVKIVDILPATVDELRSILFPTIQNLDLEQGTRILELVNKYR